MLTGNYAANFVQGKFVFKGVVLVKDAMRRSWTENIRHLYFMVGIVPAEQWCNVFFSLIIVLTDSLHRVYAILRNH